MLVVHHLNWMEWLRMHLIASYVAHVSLIVVRVKSIRGMLMIIDTEVAVVKVIKHVVSMAFIVL